MAQTEAFNFTYDGANVGFSEYIYYVSSYHYNWHPDIEVLVVLSGSLEITYDQHVSVLHVDDVIVLPPNCGHASLSLEENTKAMVLHIKPEFFETFAPEFKKYSFFLASQEDSRYDPFFMEIRRRMAQIMLIFTSSQQMLSKMFLEMQFMKLATRLLWEIEKIKVVRVQAKTAEENNAIFNKMIEYIDKNYRSKIELEDLAKLGGYNLSYASQFFKRQLGISFVDYLTRLRLRTAAVDLVNTDKRIVDISNDSGFTDVKAFNSVFKKHFHKTPSEYRKNLGKSHGPTVIYGWKEYLGIKDTNCLTKLQEYSQEDKVALMSYQNSVDLDLIDEVKDTLATLLERLERQ